MRVRTVLATLLLLIPAPGTAAAEPANVGDAKSAAIAYYESGAYQHDLAEVAAQAINWIGNQVPTTARAAVVFDIDETALSNWEVIRANDFGRFVDGPCDLPDVCAWRAWDLTAQSTVIQPTLDTYNTARSLGAAVFFITGRDEGQRAATEQNLQSVGYTGYTRLVMTPPGAQYASAADVKALSAPRSKRRATASSPTSVTSRRIWPAATRSRPSCCPTRSTGSPEALPPRR